MSWGRRRVDEQRITVCFLRGDVDLLDRAIKEHNHVAGYNAHDRWCSRSEAIRKIVKATAERLTAPAGSDAHTGNGLTRGRGRDGGA